MMMSSALLSPTTPSQVWLQLTTECRRHAIGCVAQLVLNVVTADPDRIILEVTHEHPEHAPQTARHPSPAPGVDLYPPIHADPSA